MKCLHGKVMMMVVAYFCVLSRASGDVYTMTNSDVVGTSSFNAIGWWVDSTGKGATSAPCAGNDYVLNQKSMRTPEAGGNYVFQGDSLTLNGSMIGYKVGAGVTGESTKSFSVTVDNLIVTNTGTISLSAGAVYGKWCGKTTIRKKSTLNLTGTDTFYRYLDFYSPIVAADTSSAIAFIIKTSDKSDKGFFLYALNTNFCGQITLNAYPTELAIGNGSACFLGIVCEENLGTAPSTYQQKWLVFNGATLRMTNSVTLDDANRGIWLNNIDRPANSQSPGGTFCVGQGATSTVACTIGGVGPFCKSGAGTLVLTGKNTSLSSSVTVFGGTLEIAAADSLPAIPVTVQGDGSMLKTATSVNSLTLLNGGSVCVNSNGMDIASLAVSNGCVQLDLTDANPDLALLRVSGTATRVAAGCLCVNLAENSPRDGRTYKLLVAGDLSGFDDYSVNINPPWAGKITKGEADNKQCLFFTTTPEANIAYKTLSDNLGITGFSDTAGWSDLAVPCAGKVSVTTNCMIRLPDGAMVTNFPGDRLIVQNNYLSLKTIAPGYSFIDDLVVCKNAGFLMSAGFGTACLAGNILMAMPSVRSALSLSITSHTNHRSLNIYSQLRGFGNFFMALDGDPEYDNGNTIGQFSLFGVNTNFYGKITLNGNSNSCVLVTDETGLGNSETFAPDQIAINGSGLGVTNNVTLDDANRGITILGTGHHAERTEDEGSFNVVGGTNLPGGATFWARQGSTFTVNCPVCGSGELRTRGKNGGTVVLGGSNSYTGGTTVVEGTCVAASSNAFGTAWVKVNSGATLAIPYPNTMANGFELSGPITFENGSKLTLVAASAIERRTTINLFRLPKGVTINASDIPFVMPGLRNFKKTVKVVDRQVSVTLAPAGFVIMLKSN